MKNVIYILVGALSTLAFTKGKPVKLKPERFISIKVPEPSDICYSEDDNSFYIVSDNGLLFQTDTTGKILQKSPYEGIDFEGVYVKDDKVYVVNETMRKVHRFNKKDLALEETYLQNYSGGRNKGYESITFNEKNGRYVMVTEKDLIYIHEYDENFNRVREFEFSMASDISSVTYYNDFLWFLSDEDMMVFKIDPLNYQVIDKWEIPVLNPEGITFMKNGTMVISADDLERLYYFKNPESK